MEAQAPLTPEEFRTIAARLEAEVARRLVGQQAVLRHVLICLIAGGHALLEGVPGLGKTMLVRTLADVLALRFSRVQFTPDLMPADIIGTNILTEVPEGGRRFQFQPGPIFANLVLADEINRATPKTQSALLEAMQERTVTVANTIHRLEEPFFVLATQNPIEMEGTYPLPEAQLDRFLFKLQVEFPQPAELVEILARTTTGQLPLVQPVADGPLLLRMSRLAREVPTAPEVLDYAVRLVVASHPTSELAPPLVRRFARYGASPRGAQALVLAAKIVALLDGRARAEIADVRAVAPAALRHRLLLNFEGEAEGLSPDALVAELLRQVPAGAAA
ncbi:MAG TPA: MoxR family ATPase [Chloroflexota bacterium]|jgi:MoxR-like ATPase|nr:MoxR family ATPase [Chloroflexota bacterium]